MSKPVEVINMLKLLRVEELKRVKGNSSSYTFDEDDLFVRAKINSTDLKEYPYRLGETKQAWVQPVIVR